MAMPAGAAALPSPPFDLDGRSFALLNRAERDGLGAVLQPLAWIDGLVTAVILAPEEPEGWMEYIWLPGELGNLTASQSVEESSVVDDHIVHVAGTLCDDPEAYRPYLDGAGDRMEAAAQWAAGFRFGICLLAEPWGPLLANDDARSLLAAIFSLERDEDMPEEERADSPFRDMPADRREHMRRTTLQILPQVVLALHDHALGVCEVEEGARSGEEPYVRAAPRIGRNDPCSCGSGKKYKRCCPDA